MLTNPISIEVYNLDGQVTDDLEAQDGSGLNVTETSSAAALAELASAAISPSSYSRWTHYQYATEAGTVNGLLYAAGDLISERVYSNILAGSYFENRLRLRRRGARELRQGPVLRHHQHLL